MVPALILAAATANIIGQVLVGLGINITAERSAAIALRTSIAAGRPAVGFEGITVHLVMVIGKRLLQTNTNIGNTCW